MLPIRSFFGAALLLAGTAAFAPAAGAPDKKLPEFELFDFAQTGASSVADLAGRAVLYEFFAFWWGPCGSSVPHLNELHEKFNNEGLTIVGVTSESKAETEPWVKEKGAKYAYAYDKGGKFQNAMGVNGIPHALLVNSQGAIVWEGHPGSLNEDEIRKALTGALKRPLWDLPKTFAPVKTAFLKGDFATAIKAASAMPGDDAKQLAETIKSVVAGTLASADKKKADGDFLGAQKDYQRLAKGVKGLPEEQAVTEGIAFLGKDADAIKGIKLQKELEKILELPAKSKGDKAKRREALETFATKNPGTFAAAVAKKAVVDMTKQ